MSCACLAWSKDEDECLTTFGGVLGKVENIKQCGLSFGPVFSQGPQQAWCFEFGVDEPNNVLDGDFAVRQKNLLVLATESVKCGLAVSWKRSHCALTHKCEKRSKPRLRPSPENSRNARE